MNAARTDLSVQPGYFDLKALALYASCSVRWLRDRLTDKRHPLPYHRIEGKILIRREDFDTWISRFRTTHAPNELDVLVDGMLSDLLSKKAS